MANCGARCSAPLLSLFALHMSAASAHQLEELEVTGRKINLVGSAISASQGVVGPDEISVRPQLRSGDILELVPGLVVTQHSGTGKANQYFLRGFNLDHGTDFATFYDGMPVNLRSHGHGQGYTDLNFIIPELVGSLHYHKGPYYADAGDFGSAGIARLNTISALDRSRLSLTLGEYRYQRLLAVGAHRSANRNLLAALEGTRYDGPWSDIKEDVRKINVLLRAGLQLEGGELSVTGMGYDNRWNSADQIPRRAVRQGLIDEHGSVDTTVGGESSRYSLSAAWVSDHWTVNAYAVDYRLDLFSNFTYALENETSGDQFEQVDRRRLYGGNAVYGWGAELGSRALTLRAGADFRIDDIPAVGLFRSAARQRTGVVRSDRVDQRSAGLFWDAELAVTSRLRARLGLRYDDFRFKVATRVTTNANGVDLTANDGSDRDSLLSAKGSIIYSINREWEAYASAGQGFHSNDARGVTINVSPADGAPATPVDPLVRSFGAEIGLRGFAGDRLNASFALWHLDLDSELLFIGDAGNTEPGPSSRRFGFELTGYYQLAGDWTADLEYAWTDARFRGEVSHGRNIPGSIEHVVQAGISLAPETGWFGSLRLRHFGKRPLVEDGSVYSDPTTVINVRAGYRWRDLSIRLDVLNLLDSRDQDIAYYYASRLPNEPSGAGFEDIHYHVIEPRMLRVSVDWRFKGG